MASKVCLSLTRVYMSSNKAFTVLYLEVLLVVVVDGGQHNAHEDVEVDDNEDCKENDKPVVIVICWHPKHQGKTRVMHRNRQAWVSFQICWRCILRCDQDPKLRKVLGTHGLRAARHPQQQQTSKQTTTKTTCRTSYSL